MRAVRLSAVAVMAAWACGCAGETRPTMAGGKPVTHWVEELKGPDPKHRKEAVEKLGNVGPSDPAAFPAVCGALKDADPGVRCEAVLAVLKFGDAAREAIPTLADLRDHDRDRKVRTYATKALELLQGKE